MAFTIEELRKEIKETYKLAKFFTPYLKNEGISFTEDFTFADLVEENYIEFLVNMAFSSGEFSKKDADAIRLILDTNVSYESMKQIYLEDVKNNKLRNHTKRVACCVEIMSRYERMYSELLSDFPSTAIRLCEVMDKTAIVFNKVIEDSSKRRSLYHKEAMEMAKNHLKKMGII